MKNIGPRDYKVVALEFATALDAYETAFAAWTASPQFSNFRLADDQLSRMRALRDELPELASDLVKLVIAHADLSSIEIDAATGSLGKPRPVEDIEAVRKRHCDSAKALRAHCQQLGGWQ